MEKADEILANMGISDSVPLSEASTESLHTVGKKYDEDLPQIDDSQRVAILEACCPSPPAQTEIDDTDCSKATKSTEPEEEVTLKFKPARRFKKANPEAKPTKKNPVVIVADHKDTIVSKALQEMTSVGCLGVNMAGPQKDPMKPKKKRKKKKKTKKGNKATDSFLTNTLKNL